VEAHLKFSNEYRVGWKTLQGQFLPSQTRALHSRLGGFHFETPATGETLNERKRIDTS
jgi:hypothetical protein